MYHSKMMVRLTKGLSIFKNYGPVQPETILGFCDSPGLKISALAGCSVIWLHHWIMLQLASLGKCLWP